MSRLPRPIAIEIDAERGTFALVFEIGSVDAEELLSEALAAHGDVPTVSVPQDATRKGVRYS